MAEPMQSARKRMGSGDLVPEPTGASPAATVGAVRRTPRTGVPPWTTLPFAALHKRNRDYMPGLLASIVSHWISLEWWIYKRKLRRDFLEQRY
jgi:hypothetical protein